MVYATGRSKDKLENLALQEEATREPHGFTNISRHCVATAAKRQQPQQHLAGGVQQRRIARNSFLCFSLLHPGVSVTIVSIAQEQQGRPFAQVPENGGRRVFGVGTSGGITRGDRLFPKAALATEMAVCVFEQILLHVRTIEMVYKHMMPTAIRDELEGGCCRHQCAPCDRRNVSRSCRLEDLDRSVSKALVPQKGPNAPLRPAGHRLPLKVFLPHGPHFGLGLDVVAREGERRQNGVRVNRLVEG